MNVVRVDDVGADPTADGRVGGDDAIIDVRHVGFGYKRGESVLDDVSFSIPPGQSLGILGYNGVGKSTLLNLIMGLLRPWSGRVVINADHVPSMRDVFLMTEESDLVDAMSVRDNIRFRALLFDTDHERTGAGFADLADGPLVRAFGLEGHLDKRVSELSSGLRKRAGLVAGMLFDPHVIMLDEPTNAVDPMTRGLLIKYMNRLREDGRTLLTVTHDLDYCWRTVDRIIILDHGHLVKDLYIRDFDDYEAFERAATTDHPAAAIDFGIKHRP